MFAATAAAKAVALVFNCAARASTAAWSPDDVASCAAIFWISATALPSTVVFSATCAVNAERSAISLSCPFKITSNFESISASLDMMVLVELGHRLSQLIWSPA